MLTIDILKIIQEKEWKEFNMEDVSSEKLIP